MSSVFSTAGLARRSGSRPWLVVAAWIWPWSWPAPSFLVSATPSRPIVTFTNNPESIQGFDALEDAGLRDDDEFNETIVIRSDQYTVDSPEFQAVVTDATDAARGVTEWVDPNSVFNYYEATASGAPEAEALVSEDRHATIIPVTLLPGVVDEPAPYLDAIHAQAEAAEGFELLTVGTLSINEEFNTIAEEDLAKGEGIGGIFALIVLVFVFGALLAAVGPDRPRDLGDLRLARPDRRAGLLLRPVVLHHQHDHDDRPRGRHRLRPVHRRALPGRAPPRPAEA